MKVQKDYVVAISYELQVEGKIADRANSDAPLEYIHGNGMLLPKFEEALEGKGEGDSFAFTLTPEEGYGKSDPNMQFDIPKTAFMLEGQVREDLLVPGNIIPMYNSTGHVIQGIVVAVGEESVTMNFNHPMADKTLNFSGKVEKIRKATEKELKEGLHGEFLPQEECHCGCHHEDGEECGCGCGHEHEGHGECGCGHEHKGEGECHCHKK